MRFMDWDMPMYRAFVKVLGGRPSRCRPEHLEALRREFPDIHVVRADMLYLGARLPWSSYEDKVLHEGYAKGRSAEIAKITGRSLSAVYQRAARRGLKVDEDVISSYARDKLVKHGKATAFKPGNKPHNAGIKGWDAGGRSSKTRFTKGNRPPQWKPVGSLSRDRDGYTMIKVSDAGKRRERWRLVHVFIWETENGPVPSGHVVAFRDGNKDNLDIDNLEVVTKAEMMNRNSLHRLPEDLKTMIRACTSLRRAISRARKESV
jgi:hypothetical protein